MTPNASPPTSQFPNPSLTLPPGLWFLPWEEQSSKTCPRSLFPLSTISEDNSLDKPVMQNIKFCFTEVWRLSFAGWRWSHTIEWAQ
ncbi:hypothetical protein H2248_008880 [Termitomyces sp. 'cryptogamus']|nr:hypothetical protein H2248_008880 [Termitomyces sp. 'cryptogamus']